MSTDLDDKEIEQLRANLQVQSDLRKKELEQLRADHKKELEQLRADLQAQSDLRKKMLEQLRADLQAQSDLRKKELDQFRANVQAQSDLRKKELEQLYTQQAIGKYQSYTDDCPICLQSLLGKRLGHLPCDHHFHYSCLLPWTNSNKWCPVCRCRF